ncbi:MAG: sohB [Rickettsiaceae bacterium]|nr:sohB [Rickettsiaceae bacterium]
MASKQESKGCFSRLICKIKGNGDNVAVLRLAGIIGGSGKLKKGISFDEVEDDIEKAFKVKNLKAVALQINSPGGSPVQSELIAGRIITLAKEKGVPVYSFVEDVGASGGYWLSCAGDEIYASGNSIVGSIGVIMSTFGFAEAIKKLGVERRVYYQGENKSILDPFKPEDPKDVEILLNLQKEIHAEFKSYIRRRRGTRIKKEDEDLLFSGEFWTGTKALQLGLVDGIGDMRSIIRKKYGEDIEFVKVSQPKGWLKRKLGLAGGAFAEGVIGAVSDKQIWARFGL